MGLGVVLQLVPGQSNSSACLKRQGACSPPSAHALGYPAAFVPAELHSYIFTCCSPGKKPQWSRVTSWVQMSSAFLFKTNCIFVTWRLGCQAFVETPTLKGREKLSVSGDGGMKKCVYSECRDCIDTWKESWDYQKPFKIMYSSCRYKHRILMQF